MEILLIDEKTMSRAGMALVLLQFDSAPDIVEAASLDEAERLLSEHDITLALVDAGRDEAATMSFLTRLSAEHPHVPFAVIAEGNDPERGRRCIEHGAVGFIPLDSTVAQLDAALRVIVAGGVYLPRPLAAERAVRQAPQPGPFGLAETSLSERQHEVLLLLLQGAPNKTISRSMSISENTVKAHVSAIFRAFGARNRTEAVYFATRAGIAPMASRRAPEARAH